MIIIFTSIIIIIMITSIHSHNHHNHYRHYFYLHLGTNLLNFKQLATKVGSEEVFPVIMAAIIKAIHDNGDLMRMAIGNDDDDDDGVL
jgi:glutamine synthetase type III